MDSECFRPLSFKQRKCDHHWSQVTSKYDPKAEAVVVCVHCDVRHSDYAYAELRWIERHSETRPERRERDERRGATRKLRKDVEDKEQLDEDTLNRLLLVKDIQPEARRRIQASGGHVMYCDMRDFQFSVLLPVGTTQSRDDSLYHLPSGATLYLTHGDGESQAHGDTLMYSPLYSALHASPVTNEVYHHGPVGRRAQRAENEARSHKNK